MFRKLSRAIRLEFNFLKESKLTLFLIFFLPAIFIYLFGLAGQIKVPWKEGISYFTLYASSILPLFVLFVTTQLTIMRIVGERAPYGTLDRDLLSLSRTSMFFGKFMMNGIIAIIQAGIIFSIAYFLFNISGKPEITLLVLLLTAIFGVVLGMFISVISSNKEQATQIVPFIVLILFVFNGAIIDLSSLSSPFCSIISNLPLTLSTDSLTRIINFNHSFLELSFNLFVLFLWIIAILLLGWIKFLSEGKGHNKKRILKNMMIWCLLVGVVTLVFSFNFIPKLNWSDMEIKDFKINSIKDDWGNYPIASDNFEMYLLTNSIPEIKDRIKQSEKYIWKDGNNPYAFILISKLKDESDMKKIKGSGSKIQSQQISGEEIYFYNKLIEYENNKENLKIYIWEEDKFFFIVGGFWNIPEGLIKNLIKKYPENPTPSVIKPQKNMLEDQIKNLF